MSKPNNSEAAPPVAASSVTMNPGPEPTAASSWIQVVNRALNRTTGESAPTLRTRLSCHVTDERRMLYVPPEMATLQERGLHYLGVLAARNNFEMVEDRRQSDVRTIREQRDLNRPKVALGMALMMRQAGLSGCTASLSRPHRLAPTSPLIDVPDLISMTAHATPSAKRIVLLPNEPLLELLDNNTQPIAGFGCRMETPHTSTLLTHFSGEALRCIGYSTGGQYVMHLLLGGGPLTSTRLWTHPRTLARTDIRFRLFFGQDQAHDFGLLYSTLYYNMSERIPLPWWLERDSSEDASVPLLKAQAKLG